MIPLASDKTVVRVSQLQFGFPIFFLPDSSSLQHPQINLNSHKGFV